MLKQSQTYIVKLRTNPNQSIYHLMKLLPDIDMRPPTTITTSGHVQTVPFIPWSVPEDRMFRFRISCWSSTFFGLQWLISMYKHAHPVAKKVTCLMCQTSISDLLNTLICRNRRFPNISLCSPNNSTAKKGPHSISTVWLYSSYGPKKKPLKTCPKTHALHNYVLAHDL